MVHKETTLGSRIAVYPGSFDPVHLGHVDVIHRAASQFDKLIVAVLNNTAKDPLFSLQERKELLGHVTANLPNVEVDSFRDLLIRYMKSKNAQVIIRGLRAVSDFEKELQMASLNRKLSEQIETFFIMTNPQYSYLSSSIVKEIAEFQGPLKGLVTQSIEDALTNKFKRD